MIWFAVIHFMLNGHLTVVERRSATLEICKAQMEETDRLVRIYGLQPLDAECELRNVKIGT